MKRALLTLAAAAMVAIITGALVVGLGVYDISATNQHLAPTHWLLDTAMARSVRVRGARIEVPPLDNPDTIARGLALYRAHCVECHGAPGVPPEPFALGMTPPPANLAYTAREWRPGDLYYVVSQGIKMTGMPAWEFRLDDGGLWAIVAWLKQMPLVSPAQYAAMPSPPADRVAADAARARDASRSTVGNAERGKRAIEQYACVTCHRIPGIVGPNVSVGPPLDAMATRRFIAGVLPNSEANMIRWLRQPQGVKPGTAMPDLGVSEPDARDVTAYLSRLE